MKTIYLIGGTMGVGKTAVSRRLQQKLDNCVFLDGDWCWDAYPFTVNAETKEMVLGNVRFLLNGFIRCSAYDNVVFCWVMHEQAIIDTILDGLDLSDCAVRTVSLVCDEQTLRFRLGKDISDGLRTPDVIGRSLSRLPLYAGLDTVKIGTAGKTPDEIAEGSSACKRAI